MVLWVLAACSRTMHNFEMNLRFRPEHHFHRVLRLHYHPLHSKSSVRQGCNSPAALYSGSIARSWGLLRFRMMLMEILSENHRFLHYRLYLSHHCHHCHLLTHRFLQLHHCHPSNCRMYHSLLIKPLSLEPPQVQRGCSIELP